MVLGRVDRAQLAGPVCAPGQTLPPTLRLTCGVGAVWGALLRLRERRAHVDKGSQTDRKQQTDANRWLCYSLGSCSAPVNVQQGLGLELCAACGPAQGLCSSPIGPISEQSLSSLEGVLPPGPLLSSRARGEAMPQPYLGLPGQEPAGLAPPGSWGSGSAQLAGGTLFCRPRCVYYSSGGCGS